MLDLVRGGKIRKMKIQNRQLLLRRKCHLSNMKDVLFILRTLMKWLQPPMRLCKFSLKLETCFNISIFLILFHSLNYVLTPLVLANVFIIVLVSIKGNGLTKKLRCQMSQKRWRFPYLLTWNGRLPSKTDLKRPLLYKLL